MGFTVVFGVCDLSIEAVEVGEEVGYETRYPLTYSDRDYLPSDGEIVAVRLHTDGTHTIAREADHRLTWPPQG